MNSIANSNGLHDDRDSDDDLFAFLRAYLTAREGRVVIERDASEFTNVRAAEQQQLKYGGAS